MTLNEKIEEIIKEHSYFIQNDVENFNMPEVIKELLSLIQQERESAVREFVGWIQGQAHEYKAAVHMPVNQAHIQVREVYELLNQFLQGQNK